MIKQELSIGANRIAVYESQGHGPTIFLIHGNSSSAQAYKHQLEGDFGATHRVIALDLPGHGASAPAANPETDYSLPGYAAIVAQVASLMDAEKAVFVGWSLGGHILLEATSMLPKASGIVIFGTPPIGSAAGMEKAFFPHPAMGVGFSATISEEQGAAYANAFFRPGFQAPDSFVQDVLKTDGNARAIMGTSIGMGKFTDESKIVGGLKIPLAIFHGAHEQLVNIAVFGDIPMPTLWRSSVQIIKGAGHAPHWEQGNAFNTLLADFTAFAIG